MAKPKSPTIPPHAMQRLVAQCVASGLNAIEFGRQNGLTRDQSARLRSIMNAEMPETGRQTPSGTIIPANSALTLSKLGNRMFHALVGHGTRAVETLERLNARYEPRTVDGVLVDPDFSPEDLRVSKWAISVCSVIMAFVRKDGRDESPAPLMPTLEPIQRAMEGAPPGMLTVIAAASEPVEQSAD